jgi:hypothetical protein
MFEGMPYMRMLTGKCSESELAKENGSMANDCFLPNTCAPVGRRKGKRRGRSKSSCTTATATADDAFGEWAGRLGPFI